MAKKKKERWHTLLEYVANDDGLTTFDAGPWSADKLFWWSQYIDITTSAMVGHPNWPAGVTYVDLFCGPGVSRDKSSGTRYPGSPLIAANSAKPFRKILLCEKNRKSAEACRTRLSKFAPNQNWTVFEGDSNETIDEIVKEIPDRSLVLAFVDPTGLHANFSTLRTLTIGRPVDLLILFADSMDIVRNVEQYAGEKDSNLDRVIGPNCDWRKRLNAIPLHSPQNISNLFVELFEQQLKTHLGYEVFDNVKIRNSRRAPIYRLFYASKNDRGLDFWKKSTADFRRGELSLFDDE